MRTVTYLASVAVLALVLSACGGSADGDEPAPDGSDDTASQPDEGDGAGLDEDVAAVVNGQEISAADVDAQIEALSANPQVAEALQGAEGEDTLAVLKAQVLSTTIVNLVAIEVADELGVPVTDEDVAQARAELEEEVGGAQALQDAVEREGMPEQHLAAQLRALAALRNIEVALEEAGAEDAEEDPPPEPGAPTAAEARAQRYVGEKLLEADVVVHEDYGTWDPELGRVTPPGGLPQAPEQAEPES